MESPHPRFCSECRHQATPKQAHANTHNSLQIQSKLTVLHPNRRSTYTQCIIILIGPLFFSMSSASSIICPSSGYRCTVEWEYVKVSVVYWTVRRLINSSYPGAGELPGFHELPLHRERGATTNLAQRSLEWATPPALHIQQSPHTLSKQCVGLPQFQGPPSLSFSICSTIRQRMIHNFSPNPCNDALLGKQEQPNTRDQSTHGIQALLARSPKTRDPLLLHALIFFLLLLPCGQDDLVSWFEWKEDWTAEDLLFWVPLRRFAVQLLSRRFAFYSSVKKFCVLWFFIVPSRRSASAIL